MEGLDKLREFMSEPRKVMITTHHKPDGDAMGSSLGLYNYLVKHGHDVQVIAPTDYAHFLNFLPGNDDVLVFEQNKERAETIIKSAELIFCLDFNSLGRINDMGPMVEENEGVVVMIDHHLNPDDFAQYSLSDSGASSTCELVYDFIVLMEDEQKIDKDIATCLYTGIMTDTGSFRFPITTSRVHQIVADLIDKGAPNSMIHETVFDSFSEDRLRFWGYCLSEKMKILPEFKVGIIAVTAEEINRFKVKTGDTEGLVNYPLSIDDVVMSALIIDRSKIVKLSLRSQGDVPVNEIVSEHFEGGGHKNAAGGASHDSLEKTVERFLATLPEFTRKHGLNK